MRRRSPDPITVSGAQGVPGTVASSSDQRGLKVPGISPGTALTSVTERSFHLQVACLAFPLLKQGKGDKENNKTHYGLLPVLCRWRRIVHQLKPREPLILTIKDQVITLCNLIVTVFPGLLCHCRHFWAGRGRWAGSDWVGRGWAGRGRLLEGVAIRRGDRSHAA